MSAALLGRSVVVWKAGFLLIWDYNFVSYRSVYKEKER